MVENILHFRLKPEQFASKNLELLTTEGSIVEDGTNPGNGKVYGRGRPQKYYNITEYGLKRLIADHRISKTQFWEVLYIAYDTHTSKPGVSSMVSFLTSVLMPGDL